MAGISLDISDTDCMFFLSFSSSHFSSPPLYFEIVSNQWAERQRKTNDQLPSDGTTPQTR